MSQNKKVCMHSKRSRNAPTLPVSSKGPIQGRVRVRRLGTMRQAQGASRYNQLRSISEAIYSTSYHRSLGSTSLALLSG